MEKKESLLHIHLERYFCPQLKNPLLKNCIIIGFIPTKKKNINNAFFNRNDALERGSLKLDVLEKRIRLCNDETEQDCLPER
ncbi:hypothetical protein C5167_038307 [Papaver somniferum]|uniref:Uncharacterized protein n=1 Tax=Papaver somniferum TaxID=3469 RepID=A0A4Y7ID31_PAPSO|nr:hypothetical protein C5167_038307 [Papaver somniferum]